MLCLGLLAKYRELPGRVDVPTLRQVVGGLFDPASSDGSRMRRNTHADTGPERQADRISERVRL